MESKSERKRGDSSAADRSSTRETRPRPGADEASEKDGWVPAAAVGLGLLALRRIAGAGEVATGIAGMVAGTLLKSGGRTGPPQRFDAALAGPPVRRPAGPPRTIGLQPAAAVPEVLEECETSAPQSTLNGGGELTHSSEGTEAMIEAKGTETGAAPAASVPSCEPLLLSERSEAVAAQEEVATRDQCADGGSVVAGFEGEAATRESSMGARTAGPGSTLTPNQIWELEAKRARSVPRKQAVRAPLESEEQAAAVLRALFQTGPGEGTPSSEPRGDTSPSVLIPHGEEESHSALERGTDAERFEAATSEPDEHVREQAGQHGEEHPTITAAVSRPVNDVSAVSDEEIPEPQPEPSPLATAVDTLETSEISAQERRNVSASALPSAVDAAPTWDAPAGVDPASDEALRRKFADVPRVRARTRTRLPPPRTSRPVRTLDPPPADRQPQPAPPTSAEAVAMSEPTSARIDRPSRGEDPEERSSEVARVVTPAKLESPEQSVSAIRRASRPSDEERDARRSRPEERSRLPLLLALVPALSVAGLIALGAWMAAGGSPDFPAMWRSFEAWRAGFSGESSADESPPGVGSNNDASRAESGSDTTSDDLPAVVSAHPGEEGAVESGRSPAAIPSGHDQVDDDEAQLRLPEPEEGASDESGAGPPFPPPAPVGIPNPLDPREFDLPENAETTLGAAAGVEASPSSGTEDSVAPPSDDAADDEDAIAEPPLGTEGDEEAETEEEDTLVRGQVPPVDPTSPTDVLMAFLLARGVDEMLAHVHDAERLAPVMRQYYKLGPPVPPSVDSVSLEITGTIPGTQLATHVFAITQVDGHEFPVSVEEGEGGFRVDWEGYVQCKDKLLARFLIERPDEARQFYAILRRTHYFGDDVQSLGGKVCFRVMSPLEGDDGSYAFAEREGPFFDAMADMMQWGGVYFPVVELQWVKSPAIGEPYVRLNRVVRQSWRGQ